MKMGCQMLRRCLMLISLGVWMWGCATSRPTGIARNIASTSLVTPFTSENVTSPSEVVDAVIRKIGPVRNQTNTQICFGHAVADIATFHAGQRVSAFSVAVRNFQFRRAGLDTALFNPGGGLAAQLSPNSRYMLGLASSTLESSLKASLCLDDQPPSNLSYRDANLKQLWDVYHRQFRSYIGPTEPTHLYQPMQAQLARIVPSLNSGDFIQRLSRYKPLDHALGEWFDRACHVQVEASSKLRVVGGETNLPSPDQVVQMLNRALESGEPAAIHYDSRVLDAENPSLWESQIGFHVSTIVARADMSGTRYYLLRNVWGPNCGEYAQQVANRCDRGHIWLTEAEVRRYVTSVAYYQRAE